MDLFDLCNASKDKASFLEYIEALKNDFISNPETWVNISIYMYLDAIHSWISDYHQDAINFENPGWKDIAAMLYMGKIYE